MLDTTENRFHDIELAGDSALWKKVNKLPNLKLHCFGHIHNNKDIINVGIREHNGIIYSNAAAMKDGEFDKGIQYHGNTFKF